MNYLAHAYFSFGHKEIMIGNMISDFVKGRRKFDYPDSILKGIHLHRDLDRFTDEHAATREAKAFFKPAVGLYAGAFIDVCYDHFLALELLESGEVPLDAFVHGVYSNLDANFHLLPEPLQRMLPYMKTQNWLYNYQFRWGIERSFEGVVRRAVYLNNAVGAFNAFNDSYDELARLSALFIADVKKFAASRFDQLVSS